MNRLVEQFKGRDIQVYLFEDRLVIEIMLGPVWTPLPVSWIYWVEYSEVGGLRVLPKEVLLLLRDGRVIRLNVEKPEILAKAIYTKIR